jgi:hypothetical protein
MKEAVRNHPKFPRMGWKNGWFYIYFINTLNPMSKCMFDIAAGGTFMEKKIEIVKKLLKGIENK